MSMYPLILICDDDPVVHESLGLYLSSEGYDISPSMTASRRWRWSKACIRTWWCWI